MIAHGLPLSLFFTLSNLTYIFVPSSRYF